MEQEIKNNIPKLFNLLNKKGNSEKENKIKDQITNFEYHIYINNYNRYITLFQGVVLMKIMTIWENRGVKFRGNYSSNFNYYLELLKKEEYEITQGNKIKIFSDFEGNKDINKFFSSLIILFLKQKENDQIELIKILWDEIQLSKFEINDKIKKDLKECFETDNDNYFKEFYKELYEENDLFNLDNKYILSEIYDYINYKSPVYIKIELLKDYADQERQYDDYGRTIKINEKEPPFEKFFINKNEKIPDDILKQVFKKLEIKISIDMNKKPNYNYYYGDKNEPMEQLYDKYNYNIKIKDEKNYKEYLNFDIKIKNFIKDNINNIQKYGTIKLILTTLKEEQKNQNNIDKDQIDKNQIDLYIVNCQSSFESDDSKDNNFGIFIDRNVLINGINGKTPGFIFLVNELGNED
jgi:hypothetical protein